MVRRYAAIAITVFLLWFLNELKIDVDENYFRQVNINMFNIEMRTCKTVLVWD